MMREPRPGDRVEAMDGTVAELLSVDDAFVMWLGRGQPSRCSPAMWGTRVFGAVALERGARKERGEI
jgi:hypothetical protein